MQIAAACAILMLCGCQHTHHAGRDWYSYSYKLGFRPESAFRDHGFLVTAPKIRDGETDLIEACYQTSWQGAVTVPGDTNACVTVSKVIRDELNRALGAQCEDYLTTTTYRSPEGQPFWGYLTHDEAGARLQVQVWLIPHEHTSTMSYVIYLRSADLPKLIYLRGAHVPK
jgi:hypothetical protein